MKTWQPELRTQTSWLQQSRENKPIINFAALRATNHRSKSTVRPDAFNLGIKKTCIITVDRFIDIGQIKKCYQKGNNSDNNNDLAARTGFAPAVVEGGPGRCQRQTLAELVPLPGHLAELEQDCVQVVAGWPVVVDGWGWGGRFTVNGRSCDSEHITGGWDHCSAHTGKVPQK